MGNSKSHTSGTKQSMAMKSAQKRLQKSVQKSQRYHESTGSASAFVESADRTSVSSKKSGDCKRGDKERKMGKEGNARAYDQGSGSGYGKENGTESKKKAKKTKTEKVSTPKPCVAMSFQLMSNLPSHDMEMIKDAASYSTSSYVSLTDSFEDNSFSDEEILFPLSRHFENLDKDGYGEAVFFEHVPKPRISSRDMNMDVFRGIKKSQAAKQQNAQLRKIEVAKEVADKGGEKEMGAEEEEMKQFELKIKGFAKSLPKVIEGGTIVSTPGWRATLAKKKAESESNRSRSMPKSRDSAGLMDGKKTSNSFDTGGTAETTFDSKSSSRSKYRKQGKTPGNTLHAVLDMLNCMDIENQVSAR